MAVRTSLKLSHKERIHNLLTGQPVDRTPISFWRHFYHQEHTAESLAEAMLFFQHKFDWDFMKVNPRASYHVQPWGAVVQYSKDEFDKTKITDYPMKQIEDWKQIEPVKLNAPAFQEQLQTLSLIGKSLKGKLYFVETVFSPLSVAGDLVESEEILLQHLRQNPGLIHQALEAITQSFELYVEEILNADASGIFFATTQWASANYITREEYLQFGRPYDLRVLERVKVAELNILHVCEPNNFLDLFVDYPVHLVNWDAADPSNLTLDKGYELLKRPVLGGINHNLELLDPDPGKVSEQANKLRNQMEGKKWALGPGCSILPETPELNLARLRNLVEEWS
jgi:uroporphyrinogen decarboxylase